MSTLLEKLIGSAALKDNFLKCLRIKLKPGSVTTDKIADKAVTSAKLSDSVKTDVIQAPIIAVREDLQTSISEVQENLDAHASDTTKHITAQERSTWNSKQDALTFDNLPTQGSNNPVKSGGVYSKIQDLTTTAQLIRDDVSAIQQEMPEKQNVLTFDNTPTANSDNPVKSKGIKSAIDEHTENSAIHVTGLDKTKWNSYESNFTNMAAQMNTRTLKTSDVKVYAASDLSYTTQIGEIKVVNKVAPLDTDKLSIESDHINITASGEDTDIKINSASGKVEVQADTEVNIQAREEIKITGSNDLNMFGGYVTLTATEGTTAIASADNVTISAGSSSVNKEINLNASAVKVNGKNVGLAVDKVNGMFPASSNTPFNISESGMYFIGYDINPVNKTSVSPRHGILIVGRDENIEIDEYEQAIYSPILNQTLISSDGNMYKRSIAVTNHSYNVNWNTAPNFTQV